MDDVLISAQEARRSSDRGRLLLATQHKVSDEIRAAAERGKVSVDVLVHTDCRAAMERCLKGAGYTLASHTVEAAQPNMTNLRVVWGQSGAVG